MKCLYENECKCESEIMCVFMCMGYLGIYYV